MASWDWKSPESWAAALGMVPVPLFGRHRVGLPAGDHRVLLDGPSASCTLSVVETESTIDSVDRLSWTWSSNLRRSFVVSLREKLLLSQDWDNPSEIRRSPLRGRRSDAAILESLFDAPKPNAPTVVQELLKIFWSLRANIVSLNGNDKDLVRTFNYLLIWSDAVRNKIIPKEFSDANLPLFMVLELLQTLDLVGYGPHVFSQASVGRFEITEFAKAILELSPGAGIVLNPDLFIRHASGILYEAAHIQLPERSSSPQLRQGSLFGNFTLDATPPKDAPSSDVHYTPSSLARALVQEAIRELEDMRPIHEQVVVLDPACGSGVFLLEALRELEVVKGLPVRLVGMDRSPVSCIMTDFALQRLSSDEGRNRVSVEVFEQDSLGPSFWPRADMILMNPPFISWKRMEDSEKSSVKRILGSNYKGRPDYSLGFISKAIDSLKPGSVLAAIVPATFMESIAAHGLRESVLLNDSLRVRVLGRLNYNVFKNAEIEPAFLVIRKELAPMPRNRNDQVRMVIAERGRDDATVRAMRRHLSDSASGAGWNIFQAPLSWLPEGSWLPRSPRAMGLVRAARMLSIPNVKELFDVHLGVRTGDNPTFLLSDNELQRLAPTTCEQTFFRPVADVIRDGAIVPTKHVFYPYDQVGSLILATEDAVRSKLPAYYAEKLLPLKTRKRRSNRPPKKWWELSEPRLSWLPQSRSKIVSQAFGRRGNFALDQSGHYAVVQGNAWIWKGSNNCTAEMYLAYLAILNSPLFESILSYYCPRKQRPQYELYAKYTNNILIPDLSEHEFPDSLLGDLSRFGELITTGEALDSDSLDQTVADAYGIPLSRLRVGFAPKTTSKAERRFWDLTDQWKSETAHLSNVESIIEHPAYRKIVGMGKSVIPWILDDLRTGAALWFPALVMLTGENPVPVGDYGDVYAMADSWVSWGDAKGYN